MALILIHLRRIILLVTVVYLGGLLLRKLLTTRGSRYPKFFCRRVHFQPWVYVYTIYTYILTCSVFNVRNVNLNVVQLWFVILFCYISRSVVAIVVVALRWI